MCHLHLIWSEAEGEECQQPLKLRFGHTTSVALPLQRYIYRYSLAITTVER